MKKLMMSLLSGVSIVLINGCGGGSSDSYVSEVTYYLQTYNAIADTYEGVDDVYYECGPDIVGYTGEFGMSGSFSMIEGDTCTFYDLDNTLSYEIDTLYIGLDASGESAVSPTSYNCYSGEVGITDDLGAFIFDPYVLTSGDICEFNF